MNRDEGHYIQINSIVGYLLTVLHLSRCPDNTLSPSMTIKPAMTAFVVAIAGMMLPAMAVKI